MKNRREPNEKLRSPASVSLTAAYDARRKYSLATRHDAGRVRGLAFLRKGFWWQAFLQSGFLQSSAESLQNQKADRGDDHDANQVEHKALSDHLFDVDPAAREYDRVGEGRGGHHERKAGADCRRDHD